MIDIRRVFAPLYLLLAAALLGIPGAPGQAAPAAERQAGPGAATGQTMTPALRQAAGEPRPIYRANGTIDIGPVIRNKSFPLNTAGMAPLVQSAQIAEYSVGAPRVFATFDFYEGAYVLTNYDVRVISDTVEIWVQRDLRYKNEDGSVNPIHPDTRDPEYITQDRLLQLASEFEQVIRPTDVEYFGAYQDRTGEFALLPSLVPSLNLPADYFAGPGQRTIILVTNIRDENFYDPINNPSFAIGFFSPALNAFADRNVLTIDSKRWNTLLDAPTYTYEATIAHELQHLIHDDYDSDEDLWANEGASEFAEFITGYRPTPTSHRVQFSDYPENALTTWGDQDDDPDQPGYETLADYQIAYWFQLYLAGRLRAANIGTADNQYLKLVSRLIQDTDPGAKAIDDMLAAAGAPFRFDDLWVDFRNAMLYGGSSNDTGWGSYISQWSPPSGIPVAPLDLGRLRRNLNFEGYDTPGAPNNGADYIEVGWTPAINNSTQLAFNGESAIPSPWQVVPLSTVPFTQTGQAAGNILYSGHADQTDHFMILGPLSVPNSGNQTLQFDTAYNIEETWDFGFTQVTTDTAGATGFQSLPLSGTTTITDPQALQIIKDNVPGYSGARLNWTRISYDLAAYAGKQILLAFRYSTDPATAGQVSAVPPGWYLDNISFAGNQLYADQASLPAGVRSIWQARNKNYQFRFDLATFADKNGPAVTRIFSATLDANGDGALAMGPALDEAGFNEAGERAVAMVSSIPPERDADIIGQPGYGEYSLTGLPSSLYTSRARARGTANESTTVGPRSYPGDTFDVVITVDNLGRNPDLTAAPGTAYVALPIPANASYVPDSCRSDVSQENCRYADNLQTLDSSLPSGPGLLWNGTVARTANLTVTLDTADALAIGTEITPTVHFANGPFNANPSQRFTDIENGVDIISPLALSAGAGPASVQIGSTATYTYTLINTDNAPRDVDLRLTVPTGAELLSYSATVKPLDDDAEAAVATQNTVQVKQETVPSYITTGNVLEVVIRIKLSLTFSGPTVAPKVELLQRGTSLPYGTVDLAVPGGASTISGRIQLPIMLRGSTP